MVGVAGVTATERSLAAVTVSFVDAVTPLATCWTAMVVVPIATAVTLPVEEIVATAEDEEDQATTCEPSVRFVPSLKVAVAVYCRA
jgi:hypothetical protein